VRLLIAVARPASSRVAPLTLFQMRGAARE
jgi:hypothetical protein